MDKEKVLVKIKEALEKMGCTDILFSETGEDLIVVTFNCKEITSFVAEIPGWTYTGIHLNPTEGRQYKMDFNKIVKK